MDGNRRFGKKNNLSNIEAYQKGAITAKKICNYIANLKEVSHLTLFTLSIDNVKNRPENEINHILQLLKQILSDEEDTIRQKVSFNVVGDLSFLPQNLLSKIEELSHQTKNHKLKLYLAINYRGRSEIIYGIKKYLNIYGSDLSKLSEENFCNFLYNPEMPDVDLMIRTGGKKRLSDFLPWQSCYAELVFLDKFWPDFTEKDLDSAIEHFRSIERNFGK